MQGTSESRVGRIANQIILNIPTSIVEYKKEGKEIKKIKKGIQKK